MLLLNRQPKHRDFLQTDKHHQHQSTCEWFEVRYNEGNKVRMLNPTLVQR